LVFGPVDIRFGGTDEGPPLAVLDATGKKNLFSSNAKKKFSTPVMYFHPRLVVVLY
jgi:hypothetical protein